MKNLKISNNVKFLAAGASVVIIGACTLNSDYVSAKYDGGTDELKVLFGIERDASFEKGSIKDFNQYLKDNNLVPYKQAKKYVEDMSIGDSLYAEKLICENGLGDGKWELINPVEMKVFTGILRTSEEFSFKLWNVKYEDGEYIKEIVSLPEDNPNINKYFVDLDDPIRLKYPTEDNYYHGRVRD